MTAPVYTDANFRLQFPEFASMATHPVAVLQSFWTMGTAYVSINNPNAVWTQQQAQLANDLMAAHLTKLNSQIAAGSAPGVVTGATEGSVSVSLAPPPTMTGFQYWLSSTPYGMQLRALMSAAFGVGFLVGGSFERAGFRKGGGVF